MTDRLPGLKFALFAVACVVAAAFVIQWTGNYTRIPLITSAHVYEAELDDASGLAVGDDVRVAGVRAGRVSSLGIERGKAVVTFELDPDVAITDSWETGARWRNVIGQRYLYLYDMGGGEALEPGSRIPAERSRLSADLGRLFNDLTPLLRAISPEQQNELVAALNEALDGNTAQIQQLVRELGTLGDTLADSEPEIRSVLDQGSTLLETYNERQEELSGFIAELADVGGTVAARNDELIAAITDIGEVQAQFGDLLRANDGEIRRVVDNLDFITDRIRTQREDGYFEEALATTRAGLGTYMLISRRGQWFDVRAVAVQVQDGQGGVLYCETEGGAACSEPNSQKATRGEAGGVPTSHYSIAPARRPALGAVTAGAMRGVAAASLEAARDGERG